MARAVCAVDDLERGDVPAISVKSGKPCANPVALSLRVGQTTLSPVGRKIIAVVPLEPSRVQLHKMLHYVSLFVLVLFAASLAAAFTIGLALAAVCFLVYVLLVVAGDTLWIKARDGADRDHVVLTRVHPAFARAVDVQ